MTYLDPCPLGKWISTVSCPGRKSTCPRQLDRHFFEPCITISCFITCCCGPQINGMQVWGLSTYPHPGQLVGSMKSFPLVSTQQFLAWMMFFWGVGGGGLKVTQQSWLWLFAFSPSLFSHFSCLFFCLLLGIEKASFWWKTFLGKLLGS